MSAQTLKSIHMADAQHGWVLSTDKQGRAILHTNDGGRTWKNVTPPVICAFSPSQVQEYQEDGKDDFQLACLSTSTVWAVEKPSDNTILVERSQDSGRHWQASYFKDRIGMSLTVQFLDQMHGSILAVSEPATGKMEKAVYRTHDGGRTWQPMAVDESQPGAKKPALPMHGFPTGMIFRTPQDGWETQLYREDAIPVPVYHSLDSGMTWRLQSFLFPPCFQGGYANANPPIFFGKTRKIAVLPISYIRHDPEKYFVDFYHTQDCGRNWHSSHCLPILIGTGGLTDNFVDAQHGWVLEASGNYLYRTRDGGQSWTRLRPKPALGKAAETQLEFVNSEIGFALVTRLGLPLPNHIDTYQSMLLQTHDGGRHWHILYPPRRKLQ